MPTILLLCTVFTIVVSYWRFDAVGIEKESIENDIDQYSFDWIENYYIEMDSAVQIFFDQGYSGNDFLSFFSKTLEQRLSFWNDFSLLPSVIDKLLLFDEAEGSYLYVDMADGRIRSEFPEVMEAYLASGPNRVTENPYYMASFPLYYGTKELPQPFIRFSEGDRSVLILLDYQAWRFELPSLLSKITNIRGDNNTKLFSISILEGGQELADEIIAAEDREGFPLTQLEVVADYNLGRSFGVMEIPEILSENSGLQYSVLTRNRLNNGADSYPDEEIFNDYMNVKVPGISLWAELRKDKNAIMIQAVMVQLGAILLSYAALALLFTLFIILYRYNLKASRLVAEQRSFVANVSHELRTPLAVICNAGANMEEGFVEGMQRVKKYGRMISEEGGRLTIMVEGLLLYSGFQLGRSRKEELQVDVIMSEIIKPIKFLCEQKSIIFEQKIEPNLKIFGDSDGIRSSVMNLLTNAVVHGGEGGWVRLTVASSGCYLEIRVEDGGPGIIKIEQKKIFAPFTRGSTAEANAVPGSGLGLSLVEKVSALHGGSVEIESEPGRGAVFTLRLLMRDDNE